MPKTKEPTVMEWGQDVLKLMNAIARAQNDDDTPGEALATQHAIVAFRAWLWDLSDNYVHEPAQCFTVATRRGGNPCD
jgi:hypothetical protein